MPKRLRKSGYPDVEDVKEKIDFAKKIVAHEEEPFKTEGFKIIFARLLGSSLINMTEVVSQEIPEKLTSLETKKNELAKQCSITIEELEDVFSIKQDSVKIISPINGNDAFKRFIASQCYLIASEIVLGKDWIESKELAEVMREIGVKDLSNLSPELKKNSDIFRVDAKRGHNKYKLTSGIGRNSAFKIIRKLAKSEDLNEN